MTTVLKNGSEISYSRDLPKLVWQTDPDLFRFLFLSSKELWAKLFEVEWAADYGLHSFKDTTVAVVDGEIVGVLVCFPAASTASRFEATLKRFKQGLDDETSRHIERAMEQMSWLFPPAPDDALLVYNLVVREKLRGSGIGRLLMSEAEGKAHRHGCRSIHLDTATNNPAVAFYRRVGYEPLIETRLCRLRDGEAVPSHFRMVKDLQERPARAAGLKLAQLFELKCERV